MHRPSRLAVALLLLLPVALVACGDSDDATVATTTTTKETVPPTVNIVDASVEVPPNPDQAAVRMVIENETSADDVLLSASSPDAQVAIHRSSVDDDGLATMKRVKKLKVPARSKVTFAPGGLHVMLTNIDPPLVAGGIITLRLTFQKAGIRSAQVPVVAAGSSETSSSTSTSDGEHSHGG